MKRVYLLTGTPGTGKTSLVKQVVAGMKGKAGGFYTEEIRTKGARQGFRLVTLDGRDAILAHVDTQSQYRVGKYGVDIDGMERIGVPALHKALQQCDLVVVDEIGKMELFSANFQKAVSQIIDSGKRMLGTITLNPNPWADAIKQHPQVNLVTVTRANHQQVLAELMRWVETAESPKL